MSDPEHCLSDRLPRSVRPLRSRCPTDRSGCQADPWVCRTDFCDLRGWPLRRAVVDSDGLVETAELGAVVVPVAVRIGVAVAMDETDIDDFGDGYRRTMPPHSMTVIVWDEL